MNGDKNKNLDRMLGEAIGRPEPTFDFARWQADHSDAIARYRQRTRQKPRTDGVLALWRAIMNPKLIKFAAAAVIVVGVIMGLYHLENAGGSSVAFAAVIERIQSSGYTFELSDSDTDGQNSHVVLTVQVLKPGLTRFDTQSPVPATGPMSIISDFNQQKTLVLFHRDKTAVQKDVTPDLASQLGILGLCRQPVENLWNLRNGMEKPIGQKEIDGRKAQGFKISQSNSQFDNEITVWADIETANPLLVEIAVSPLDKSYGPIDWKLDHFNLGVQLDPGLFSFELPSGYTAAFQNDLKKGIENGSRAEKEKIVKMLDLGRAGRIDEAVDSLLKVDFNQPIHFSGEPLVFSLKEKECIFNSKPMNNDLTVIKNIAKAAIARGQGAAQNGQTEQAEKLFAACQRLAQLLDDKPDLMIITRLVGIKIEQLALNELISLYERTGQSVQLRQANDRLRYINDQFEAIRRQASSQR
jgi:outer membrane lipoprotein-sorting protein